MKLLYCNSCQDVLAIKDELRTCECGKCKARKKDKKYTEWNGQGAILGIDNRELKGQAEQMMYHGHGHDPCVPMYLIGDSACSIIVNTKL